MFYYVFGQQRAGADELLQHLRDKLGFRVHAMAPAPTAFKRNPLASGDDDALQLHFNELEEHEYTLVVASKDAAAVEEFLAWDTGRREQRRQELEALVAKHQHDKTS